MQKDDVKVDGKNVSWIWRLSVTVKKGQYNNSRQSSRGTDG